MHCACCTDLQTLNMHKTDAKQALELASAPAVPDLPSCCALGSKIGPAPPLKMLAELASLDSRKDRYIWCQFKY